MFNFNGKTPKEIIFNGKSLSKLLFNGVEVWRKSLLPSGYKRCEYLQSADGRQWIDTNVIATGSSVEFKASVFQPGYSNAPQCVFWTRLGGRSYISYGFIANSSTQVRAYMGTHGDANITKTVSSYSNPITVRMEKGRFTLNGKTYSIDKNQTAVNYPISLFHLFELGKPYNGYSGNKVKIYYFKIFKNNELVFDGIPALDENNKPCMYDTVSKQTFYNKGTGEFLYAVAK